jgi:hypothetical protein
MVAAGLALETVKLKTLSLHQNIRAKRVIVRPKMAGHKRLPK